MNNLYICLDLGKRSNKFSNKNHINSKNTPQQLFVLLETGTEWNHSSRGMEIWRYTSGKDSSRDKLLEMPATLLKIANFNNNQTIRLFVPSFGLSLSLSSVVALPHALSRTFSLLLLIALKGTDCVFLNANVREYARVCLLDNFRLIDSLPSANSS